MHAAADPAAELHDPLAELHMEDYDTDEEQGEMQEATASRLFGGGNPGKLVTMSAMSKQHECILHEH